MADARASPPAAMATAARQQGGCAGRAHTAGLLAQTSAGCREAACLSCQAGCLPALALSSYGSSPRAICSLILLRTCGRAGSAGRGARRECVPGWGGATCAEDAWPRQQRQRLRTSKKLTPTKAAKVRPAMPATEPAASRARAMRGEQAAGGEGGRGGGGAAAGGRWRAQTTPQVSAADAASPWCRERRWLDVPGA